MTGLLRLLRDHADAVEADLSRFHGIDYRDRWRREAGRPKLTLRMIAVRLRHLPLDAATPGIENGGMKPWDRVEHLLDEVRLVLLKLGGVKDPKPEPSRTQTRKTGISPKRLAAARSRARERRRRIEAGEIV